ncbi:cytochrome c biogenesis CcdA family protein [Streptomyces coeruleorubidus]|uniref:Cytochrome c biogenesis protein CcdA n=1 Tax=Streptomyces coeruleorubidus TaxID=116188 RepID=A0A5J6I692_STRC4|nr:MULTISPECIES: cytochrome c biogenesis protein CcdA [Streptomyces]MDG9708012.1 cytochrome c biogenesis protein CcdA [Streptomyces sp. DH10]QEV27062.1 cytochrome c biogenesis protein CcdA [Streptomyces coeruleorubidus]WOT35096.1 cytochrome c biogenesis protein CcdA [Streptomyces coeruleorubidus]GGT94697.1 cytochrome C biogenesis protein CcdA [Streptomyces coeruleorubidus]GGU11855.1 cytochrome C biogenesis protein CcdA [Streptomyces bellus]
MSALTLAAVADPNGTVLNGALLVALPIALLGGLVSFFSPCVLPLVPGYLSYVTGVAGTDLAEARRGRMVAGASLFVLGFTAVFVSSGALFGYFGDTLQEHKDVLSKVLGVLMILMGVFFMGLMPWFTQREFRLHRKPVAGLVGAPLLGALFGIGWTPCIGPTLASVLALSSDQGSAGRGAALTVAYCLGLGVPFVLAAVAFRKALGAFGWIKRHYVWVMRIGGTMMIVTGLLLLTGAWDRIVQEMQVWSDGFTVGI